MTGTVEDGETWVKIKSDASGLIEKLQDIFLAVDDLELSVDNIDIDLDSTNTLIQTTNDAIAALEAANDISGDDTVTAIEAAETSLNAALVTLQASTETHSDEEQAAIASLEAAVAAFHAAFDARDLATETTLADLLASTGDETDVEATADGSVIAILKRIRTRLDQSITDFNTEDFASETTLAAFKAANNADILALKAANDASGDDIVTAIEALEAASDTSGDDIVTAINDCCTTLEASLTAIEADIEAFKAEAHADSLDTQAAVDELKAQNLTKHDAIITELQDVEADVEAFKAAFDARDLATETTLAAQPTQAQQTADLQAIEDAVDELKDQNETKHDSIITQLEGLPNDAHEFARLKNKEFVDTEELRYDIPVVLASADIYLGSAPDGTATSSASWTVIRTYFDAAAQPSRERIRKNVAWDDRATGW